MNAPLRVTLADVGARRRAQLARPAPPPLVAPAAPAAPATPTPAPAPLETLDARRAALTAKIARLQRDMHGKPPRRRAALGVEMVSTQAALTAINAEMRAQRGATGGNEVPLRIVVELLAILDRAQDAGFVRDDAEHAEMDAAAGWLEANGRGQR